MRMKYGTFNHPINLTRVSETQRKLRNEGKNKFLIRKRLLIEGVLIPSLMTPPLPDTEAGITTAKNLMEVAYAVDGLSGGLFQSDDVTPSAHYFLNSATYDGVRVSEGPDWIGNGKAEYQRYRTFRVVLEADFVSTSNVIELFEDIEITGTGGPRKGYVELISDVADEQIVNSFTLSRAVQRGQGIWTTGPVAIPPPIWPEQENEELRQYGTPSLDLDSNRYIVRWAYFFTSPTPFNIPALPAPTQPNALFSNGNNWIFSNGNNVVFNS